MVSFDLTMKLIGDLKVSLAPSVDDVYPTVPSYAFSMIPL